MWSERHCKWFTFDRKREAVNKNTVCCDLVKTVITKKEDIGYIVNFISFRSVL